MTKRIMHNFKTGPCDNVKAVRRELISLGADLDAKGVILIIGKRQGKPASGGAIAPMVRKAKR